MSKRAAFWLAWSTWTCYLVLAIGTLLLQVKNAPSELPSDIFSAVVLLAFETVGALIASRRPQHPIGWIFCLSALFSTLGTGLLEYTFSALITVPGSLPAGALMGVFGAWARSIGWFLVLTFLLLLFPNGHLPSPQWRFLAWLIAALLVVYSITFLLSPYPYANSAIDPRLTAVRNPMGIGAANDLFDQLGGTLPLLLYPTILVCIVAVVLRFRRARGIERQQLKWFTYGLTISVLMLIIILILIFTTPSGGAGWLFYLALVCIPITTGIAMLRYRLYDIDVLINRTLVYGLLTAILAALYFGLVLGLQFLFDRVVGPTAASSPLILVGSTLAIAALFHPLRRSIQEIIDHRFYRRKYNTARTLATFSAILRNEVDLAILSDHLVAVVQETMQPTSVSLWLRPPASSGTQHASWSTTLAGPSEKDARKGER
jgi:hypothetical protein